MKKEHIGLIQIIIASLLFGFIPIVVRMGSNINSYTLSFFRVLVSVISLIIYFVIFKERFMFLRYDRKKMIFFGAIHGFIILGYFIAIQNLSVALAVILLYSSSIWMIIFSRFILREKITKKTTISLIIALVGLFLVISPQGLLSNYNFIGILSGVLSGVGFGLVYVLSKTFTKYDKVSLTFWQNLISLPFLLPSIFISLPEFSFNNIILIVLLGTLFTTIPFILVFKGFQKVKGQQGAIAVLLDIIFPILLALIIFKEVPTVLELIGGGLIILGVILSSID